MATIRHIALMCDNPKELAKFYNQVFGLTIRDTGATRGAWVTDGYIEMALLQRRGEDSPQGINHFGFTLDPGESKEAVHAKLQEFGCKVFFPGPNRPYAEEASRDPEGNRFDIASTGYEENKGRVEGVDLAVR